MNLKFDRLYIGLLAGGLLPVLASFLYYTFMYKGGGSYFQVLMQLNQLHLLGILLTVSVLPNLLMFYFASTFERLLTAKGILYATGFYVSLAVIYRFLF